MGGPPVSPGGSGGRRGLIVALCVLGVIALIVVGLVATGLGNDGNDAEVVVRTTLTSPLVTTPEVTTTTGGAKPGDSALDPSDNADPPADPTTINVFDLVVGDCFDVPTDGNITDVTAIPCAEAHDNEVFATFDIVGGPNAPFPGEASISSEAQTSCTGDLFTDYVGLDFQSSRFQATSINPTQETWESDLADREVICVATSADDSPLTETVRGSNE